MKITMTVGNVASEYVNGLLCEERVEEADNLPESIIELMAAANHNSWMQSKIADGYKWGEKVDDVKKTHPLIKEYSELSEESKEENRRNARETVQLLARVGCVVMPDTGTCTQASKRELERKVYEIVEMLHNSWALGKARKGYVYGEIRNDDPKKGPLTHRDMLPFGLLMKIHPEDAEYDFKTARGAIQAVQDAGYIISIKK